MPKTFIILKEFLQKIKSNFILIAGISLLIGAIVFFVARTQKGTYSTYSKIFPLSINKANSNSPVDAIKSQFGISDKTDFDKIYNVNELVSSRIISRKIVSAPPKNKKHKTLAQWILNDYNNNRPLWGKKIITNPKDSMDLIYKSASLFLAATQINTDAKTGFTKITTTFHDKELCKETGEEILAALSEYYISLVTAKPRSDLGRIRFMRDSIRDELYAIERNIAGFQDANQFAAKASVYIPQAKSMRMKGELEQLYTITATAFQNAKFKLLYESPIFQVLDYPGEPYSYFQPSHKKAALIAFALCFLLLCLIVCRNIIWRLIMEDLSKA